MIGNGRPSKARHRAPSAAVTAGVRHDNGWLISRDADEGPPVAHGSEHPRNGSRVAPTDQVAAAATPGAARPTE